MKTIIIFLIVLTLYACTSTPTHHWIKDGVPYEQMKADQFDCDYMASAMTAGQRDEIIRAIANNNVFRRCMESRGYRFERIR